VAVKVAVLAPDVTATEAGTVNTLLLSDSDTEVLLVAVCANVTVQVEVPPDATVVGEH
jgi:hypothetical protein